MKLVVVFFLLLAGAGNAGAQGNHCELWVAEAATYFEAWASDEKILHDNAEVMSYALWIKYRREFYLAHLREAGRPLYAEFGDIIKGYRLPYGFQFESLDAIQQATDVMADLHGVVRRTDHNKCLVEMKEDGVLTLLLHEDATSDEILDTLEYAKMWARLRWQLGSGISDESAREYARWILDTPQAILVLESKIARRHIAAAARPISSNQVQRLRNWPLQHALIAASNLKDFVDLALDIDDDETRRSAEYASNLLNIRIDEMALDALRVKGLVGELAGQKNPRFPKDFFLPLASLDEKPTYFSNENLERLMQEKFRRSYPRIMTAPPRVGDPYHFR